VVRSDLQDGVALSAAAARAGVSARTARRWLARYRTGGLAALARPTRSDHGRRRTPAVLVELIEGLALRRPAPPIAFIHRQVGDAAREQGWPAPSYATVHAVVRALDPGLVVLAHDGPVRYRERYELVYRREAAAPNEIWQADHTQLDILIVDEHGRAVRPWLTVIEDDHSRAIAGYVVFVGAPSALQTALALRQAIWRKPHAAWGGVRHPGHPVLRSRRGLHQPPHRGRLRRPAHRPGALDGRRAAGTRQARAAVRHDHQRACVRPTRLARGRLREARNRAHAVAV
jgi:putative transposase